VRALRDTDVHLENIEVPYITVRCGKPPMHPTKGGKVREIPLLPMAEAASPSPEPLSSPSLSRAYSTVCRSVCVQSAL
jgi:hypothetical protein